MTARESTSLRAFHKRPRPHAYAKYAPAQEDKDSGTDIPIVAIIVTALGAIVAVVGLRYHPAILIVGVVVAAVGGLDIGGIISLF